MRQHGLPALRRELLQELRHVIKLGTFVRRWRVGVASVGDHGLVHVHLDQMLDITDRRLRVQAVLRQDFARVLIS